MRIFEMKKIVAVVFLLPFILGSCSYLSKINPWAEEKTQEQMSESKVNPFLWQASLNKLGFMPIQVKNQDKGEIVTDWYARNKSCNEQFKVVVHVLSKELRSDAVKVQAYKRMKVAGKWQEQQTAPQIQQVIELSILKEARKLYQQSFNQ